MFEGNKPIDIQIYILKEILFKNEKLLQTLKVLEEYAKEKPKFKNCYFEAGANRWKKTWKKLNIIEW